MLSIDRTYMIWQEFLAFGPEEALRFAFELAAKYDINNIDRQDDPQLFIGVSHRGMIGPHTYGGCEYITRASLKDRVYDISFVHNRGLNLTFHDEFHDPRTFRNHRAPNPAL